MNRSPPGDAGGGSRPRRNGPVRPHPSTHGLRLMARSHPLRELYFSRLREFYRQPARIFWVYGFPTVLAICLGFAFQSRPPESIQLDLVDSPSAAPVKKALQDY